MNRLQYILNFLEGRIGLQDNPANFDILNRNLPDTRYGYPYMVGSGQYNQVFNLGPDNVLKMGEEWIPGLDGRVNPTRQFQLNSAYNTDPFNMSVFPKAQTGNWDYNQRQFDEIGQITNGFEPYTIGPYSSTGDTLLSKSYKPFDLKAENIGRLDTPEYQGYYSIDAGAGLEPRNIKGQELKEGSSWDRQGYIVGHDPISRYVREVQGQESPIVQAILSRMRGETI